MAGMASEPMGRPAPDTLRPSQRARRDRIVRAALRRLVSGDYESIKVADVAKDAKVALATLYRYFSSKEHLFAAVFYEWQASFARPRPPRAPRATGSVTSSGRRSARSRSSRSSTRCSSSCR